MKKFKIIRLATVILFSLIALSGCNDSVEKKQDLALIHLKQANAYFEAGQFRAAMIEAKNVLQKAPKNIDGYTITAKILTSLGQHKQAIDLLLSSNKTTATNAQFEQLLTEAYIGRKKYHSALKTLEQAQRLKQQDPKQHQLLLANCYRELGRTDEAATIYQQLLESPTNAQAHIGSALLALSQGNTLAAETTLALGAAIEPDNFQIELIGAQIKYANKKYPAAETLLTDALFKLQNTDSMTPEKAMTLNLLADVLVKQGRTAEAMIYTQKVADAFPGYDIANQSFKQAEQLAEAGNIDQAEEVLQRLLVDNPGFERASTFLAVIKYMQGDYSAASEYLNNNFDPETAHPELTQIAALSNLKSQNTEGVVSLLENYPGLNENSNLLAIYGNALLSRSEYEKSLHALERAIELDNTNIPAYLSLASYFNHAEQPKKALQYLKSAYAIDPKNSSASIALTRQYVTQGNPDQAEKHINTHLKAHDNDSASLELAGDFYTFQKSLTQSKTFYQQAIKADGNNYRTAIKLAYTLQKLEDSPEKIYAAYSNAISIEPENPVSFEHMLDYARSSNTVTEGLAAVDQAIVSNQSKIGGAVTAIFLTSINNVEQAETYRSKLNSNNLDSAVLNAVDEAMYHAKAIKALNENRINQAREYAHTGLKLAPQSLRLMKIITDIELSEKNYREAEKIIAQVATINNALGLQLNGDLHQLQDEPASALSSYQDAWNLTPDDNLGAKIYALLATEQPDSKLSFLDKWSQQFPNSLIIAELKSRNLLTQGKYKPAIILMKLIQEKQPNNAANLNNLAWSYLQTGNPQAQATAKRAYDQAPENPSIIDTYAWILHQQGMHEKALQLIKKARRIDPDNQQIAEHFTAIKAQNKSN